MGTLTDRLSLYKPANGETGWGDEVSGNFDTLESRITGTSITAVLNVKDFGAGGLGETEDEGAFRDAIDYINSDQGGRATLFVPRGTYIFASGESVTVPDNIRIMGEGPAGGTAPTRIRPKNAYAFTTTGGGQQFAHFAVQMQDDSTSGGAIKIVQSSQVVLNDVHAEGNTAAGIGIWSTGCVGAVIHDCHAGGFGTAGLQIDASDGFANHVKIYGGRYAANGTAATDAAVAIYGQNNVLQDAIVESNNGYGVFFDGTTHRMEGVWFEDNHNHNVYVSGTGGQTYIQNNYFASLDYEGPEPGAQHIYLEDITNPATASCDQIIGNHLINPEAASLYIGTNREHTVVIGNRGLTNSRTDDNGSGTWAFANWDQSNQGPTKFPDVLDPPLKIKGTTQTGDTSSLPQTALFSVADAAGEDEFAVTRKGYAVFHTPNGDPGSGTLPAEAFTLFWEEGVGLRARIKEAGGSEFTATFTMT